MTRCCSHLDATLYQVYRQPIALSDLAVRDHADVVPTRKGSFRNAFSQLQTSKLFISFYTELHTGYKQFVQVSLLPE